MGNENKNDFLEVSFQKIKLELRAKISICENQNQVPIMEGVKR